MNALRVAEDYRLGLGEGGCLSFHLSASPRIQIRLKGGCKVKYTGAARYAFVQPYQKRRAEPFGSACLFDYCLFKSVADIIKPFDGGAVFPVDARNALADVA